VPLFEMSPGGLVAVQFEILRARFLAPPEKAPGFGMTPFKQERDLATTPF